jgi:hypothetical protein
MSEQDDAFDRLRPDRVEYDAPEDPAVLSREKERFMASIDTDHTPAAAGLATPDVYPRLAYRDELAAVEYLGRVFGFVEQREARLEFDGKHLCWLRMGTGIVMVTHANTDIHLIHSPLDAGLTTAIFHVYVHDIDAHYSGRWPRGPRSPWSWPTPSSANAATRPPTPRATAGTSASASPTSWPGAAGRRRSRTE